MRIYELAKELDCEARYILDTCKSLGIDVENHMSSLSDEQASEIQNKLIEPDGSTERDPVAELNEALPDGYEATPDGLEVPEGVYIGEPTQYREINYKGNAKIVPVKPGGSPERIS